jgi:HEAT repeat protein
MIDKRKLSHSTLAKLSGLSRQQLDDFIPTWNELPVGERRRALRTLIDLAEDNVELDYNDLFRRLIGDADPEVRALAIEGLWEDDRGSTADLLVKTAQNDADETVRAAAVDGLGRFALRLALDEVKAPLADRIRAALLELASPRTPIELRRRAVEAGGYLGCEPPFRAAVQSAYATPDATLKASAIKAMGRSCDNSWHDTILRELGSGEPVVRFEAAHAAGEMEDERFVPALIDALSDDDSEVRLAAIESLGAIGGQRAQQALHRVRQGRDQAMVEAADAALEELDTLSDPLGIRVRGVNPN